jgi:hypothetical protein
MKQIISKTDLEKAVGDLKNQGKKPTLAAIHALLGHRGSMSTLVKLKAELDAAAQPSTASVDGLKAFREVWALAVEEGRKQQETVVDELRESLRALASENERLEGTVIASQNQATEAEESKKHAVGEMSQLQAAVAAASKQAATALLQLSEAQAAHAAKLELLQSALDTTGKKCHELEMQLVRKDALLEAKDLQRPVAT